MAINLMSASNQWLTRPNDERFWGLADMREEMASQKRNSREADTDIRSMKAVVVNNDIALTGEKNLPTFMSHWSFGQLSGLVGAPANYLRSLSPELAVQNINHGLSRLSDNDKAQTKILLHKNGRWMARALTSTSYGRIWNLDIVNCLTPALDRGWMVPPARPVGIGQPDPRARKATITDIVPGQEDFGLSVKVGDMIAPAGAYASDRDMFVFMVNPKRIIDDGNKGLMRGMFVWNSEVGGGAFKVKTFYLENVCGNHIVWGASNIKEIKIIHREKSIEGFDVKTLNQLQEYADMSSTVEEGLLLKARQMTLGDNRDEVVEKLFQMKPLGLSKRDLEGTYDTAVVWEKTAKAPPTTVWGMVHGLTRYSQLTQFTDERNKLDVAAGKLLDLVS